MGLEELKQLKAENTKKVLAIRSAVSGEGATLNDEQRKEVSALLAKNENLTVDIQLAEQEIEMKRSLVVGQVKPEEKKELNSLEAVRSLVKNGMTPDLVARNTELAAGVESQGVFAKRDYSHGTNGGDISPVGVKGLNILEGKSALYAACGATIYRDLKGSTQKLPFMDAFIGQVVAEKGTINRDTTSPTHVELVPRRFGIQIEVTREGLSTFNQATWDDILRNAGKAIDKKISIEMYTQILAGATEVAGAGLDKDGFDELEGEVPVDGSYFMHRKTFYTAKGVKVDAGSGQFLVSRKGTDMGETYEGTPVFHSGLFSDGANQRYVTYGVPSNIAIGFWGSDAYELIVDPYTKAAEGTLVITISRIADIKIPNVATAFVKTADLNPAA